MSLLVDWPTCGIVASGEGLGYDWFLGTLSWGQSDFCVVIDPSYHNAVAVIFVEIPFVTYNPFELANFVSISRLLNLHDLVL